MIKIPFAAVLLMLIALCWNNACNDPTDLGTEFTDQDQVSLNFTDTMRVRTRTIPGTPVITYNGPNNTFMFSLPLGRYEDPVFGVVQSSPCSEVLLPASRIRDLYNDTVTVTLDSVVLIMSYDTSGFYGNWRQGLDIQVYELMEDLQPDAVYNSDEACAKGDLLGSKQIVPQIIDSMVEQGNTVYSIGTLKIPLDPTIGERIIQADSATLSNDTLFQELFKGIILEANPAQTDGMIALNMNTSSTRMQLYYHLDTDTIARAYSFRMNTLPPVRTTYMQRDESGSWVQEFINDFEKGDSLLFLQGGNGPRIEVELPTSINELGDGRLAKAELVFTIADILQNQDALYRPLSLITASYEDGGEEVLISDLALASVTGDLGISGGLRSRLDNQDVYVLNITDHLQSLLDDPSKSRTLFINPLFPDFYTRSTISVLMKPERVTRVIMYGAGHSEFPVKLRLAYYQL